MTLSAADAGHLLRRAAFGVTPAWLGAVAAEGSREAAVDRMLDFSRNPTDDLAPVLDGTLDDSGMVELLTSWWLDRMAGVQAPLQEKLVLFWHGHFTSALDKVEDLGLLLRQNRLLRDHAAGSFHDLAQRVSVDPAMLLYLDNWDNAAGAPQENFGRELLEVFTLGVSQRTEADVVAMTRAWTGHGLDDAHRTYQFHPDRHDATPVSLFGLPPRSWNGPEALTELLFGARAEPASRFVTARLFSFFAYPVALDDPVVHRLAEGFRRSNLSIGALVRSIFLSEEFWSDRARLARVRSPVEWTVAALQATGTPALQADPHDWLRQAGHVLFNPPTVAGWGDGRYWLTTTGSWARAGCAAMLAEHAAGNGLLRETQDLDTAAAATGAFRQFGLLHVSAATRRTAEALVDRLRAEGRPQQVPRGLIQLLLVSPDFLVA